MAAVSDEPFFKVPEDDAVDTFNSIKSWPSLTDCIISDQQSTAEPLMVFRKMPAQIQREFVHYPGIVEQSFRMFAESGDSDRTVRWIIEQIPAMLFRVDRHHYYPIETALEEGNGEAVRQLMTVAQQNNMLDKLLSIRNPRYGHTLMMLAVNLNKEEYSDIILMLLERDPSGIHRFYDNTGKNVLHWCAEGKFEVSLRIILKRVVDFHTSGHVCASEIVCALEMPDNEHYTPMHYISACGKVDMFESIREYLRRVGKKINYDIGFHGNGDKSPLMVAVEHGHFDVCKWLLENGSVDVNRTQHTTCVTALHLAVNSGHWNIIKLLRLHGADVEFRDLDIDDSTNYKTPLELARTTDIPNKEACIASLTDSIGELQVKMDKFHLDTPMYRS